MIREDEEPLAVLVAKPDAERAIAALREEGVYDDSRRIRPADDARLELPVTAPPEVIDLKVVRQSDPALRSPGLRDLLRERGWSEDELAAAPGSWAVIGSIVLVRLDDCPSERERDVGEALLSIHGEADTVLADEGVSGPHREPDVRVVAGMGDTETIHVEDGTRYALDLGEVMFSPGNEAERVRMGEAVGERERVFDMFAGIGYFALPMARAGADVVAVERNPTAFRYLLENAKLNGVTDRIEAYRADCRDVDVRADRVVMGHYDATDYLDSALDALRPGGIVHVHAAVPHAEWPERPTDRIREIAAEHRRDVEILDRRVVKGYAAGVDHVVVDARVR